MARERFVLVGEIVDGRDLPVRHDEDVRRGGRVNVAERGHPIVLVDDIGGYLARDDLREKWWTSNPLFVDPCEPGRVHPEVLRFARV